MAESSSSKGPRPVTDVNDPSGDTAKEQDAEVAEFDAEDTFEDGDTFGAEETFEAEGIFEAEDDTIEAGDLGDVSDPGYESDSASRMTASLTSSVRDYAFENGRRYHKFHEGQYQFPNDEPEQLREDMKHAMVVNLCGGRLHFAPLDNPQEMLDIGTGTGIWCVDMGDEYPGSSILGVDLSPIQPEWVPPNVKFLVDDMESSWIHPEDYFDYIHGRHTSVAFKDMRQLLQRAYTAMKPGGWMELQEIHHKAHCDDGTMKADYEVQKWLTLIGQGLGALGLNFERATEYADNLREAGFVNVVERILKIPIGTWPRHKTIKTVGLYGRMMIYDGLEGNSLAALTRGLGWSAEEVQVFLVDVRKSLNDSSVHSYLPFHVVYGQKPL